MILIMEPIVYVSGGLLGDFINQLSVINEKYLETGRKGILYISPHGDYFRFGLEIAYKDTMELVKSQPYIQDYKIYNGEPYDIDLSLWRSSIEMNKSSLADIYSKVYNVEWGKHKWIIHNENPYYYNKILIHYSLNRLNYSINYSELLNFVHIDNLLFVTMNYQEYNNFISLTNKSIPFEVFDNFNLFIEAICSAGLFIGNLSAPLAIASGAHRPCLAILPNQEGYTQSVRHYINLPEYMHFFKPIL